ncbi:hypothetical protein BV22DRAFT_1016204 [Leucogyrophana mollusca]|uniref:Uncharacterized protein n=1 Tax=Leucogyrophana mollusca TaxID=85980 RepID=A0ACB8BE18_9AGAM|nr:hypothetical protein BV22DRAFT_1016204 [Leucogyrophana mollusca]
MQLLAILSFTISLALSLSSVSAGGHSELHRRHHATDVSARAVGELQTFNKRQSFNDARFTYFYDGLGACGITSLPTDFIVALNSDQYGNGAHCFETITISFGGKTAQAQIVDECPGCPYGGLDFSVGLFEYFSPLSVGVLDGEWSFN